MFKAAVASAFVVAASADVSVAFEQFKTNFGKTYPNAAEEAKRLGVFADNLAQVHRDNADHVLISGEAVFGVTKFMDLTKDEFKAMYLTYTPRNHTVEEVTPTGPLVDSIDWRTKGAVTPVKDQAQCGSCWAFSATEAIESYAFLAGKSLQKLSPQQINSCDKTDGGCNGGNTETAYAYVVKAGGLQTDADYPYTSGGGVTGTCKFDSSKIAQAISGYKSIKSGESNLQAALADGPVSVCLAATAFQTYRSGILSTCDNNVDHCVQAVGFDTTNSPPFWIVRNSWGTGWGESGYIRVEMGKDLCRISDDATYPTF